jgi:hypothetical protein
MSLAFSGSEYYVAVHAFKYIGTEDEGAALLKSFEARNSCR